jgi:hypothetical protein
VNIKDDTKVFQVKYNIKHFIVMLGDERIEMRPANILTLEYICDYESAIFAILKAVLRVDVKKKIYMLKHKREIRIKIEIEKVGMDIEVENPETNPEALINQTFAAYFNDDDENSDGDNMDDRRELTDVGSPTETEDLNYENYYESQNTLEIFLFSPDLLKASRVNFNQVYTSGTLQNVIGNMLTKSQHKQVLMSKLENYETYKELLLPSFPVFKNLLYLDQYFGLYKTGGLIFYDIDTLYILNTNGKVTAKRDDEWTETTFLIPTIEKGIPGCAMIRQPDEKIFYPTVTEKDINHQRTSIMRNVSVGSKTKIVLTDGTEITNLKADQQFIDSQTETVTYVKKENIFTESVLKARMEENDGQVFINGVNLDIGAFTPNKTFRMIYDDPIKNKKYSGEYRLAYAYHIIKIESEEFSSSSHHIILKRTK